MAISDDQEVKIESLDQAKPQEDGKRQLSPFWIKGIKDSGAGDEC